MEKLRESNPIVIRSAGSHSPVDVIAINPAISMIRLIQCKPKSMSQNARNRILKDNENLNGHFTVVFEVI